MSSYKLPPISEIKFSESIKRKLYYDPKKIAFNSNNNNNKNTNSNNTIISKSKTQLFTDQELKNKNSYYNNNNNTTNSTDDNKIKQDNSIELSDNNTDEYEDEINEIEDDENVEDEETDDEFVYLYDENNKQNSDYLTDDEDDDDDDEELNSTNLNISNHKRNNSPSEINSLKKQLSFLKKENYYMQLAINKLESRLRYRQKIDLNEIDLQKHLANIERFLTYRQNTITTMNPTRTRHTISRPYFTNNRSKLPDLNLNRHLDLRHSTLNNSRLTLPKLNLDRKYMNDNDEDTKIYSITSRF